MAAGLLGASPRALPVAALRAPSRPAFACRTPSQATCCAAALGRRPPGGEHRGALAAFAGIGAEAAVRRQRLGMGRRRPRDRRRRLVVGALLETSASLLSGCFFLSPAVQVAGVCRSGGARLAEVSPQTMIFMLCNCALWTAWGLFAPMWPAVPVNGFGLLAAACFLTVCWGFALSGRSDAPTWGRGAAAGTVAALALVPCCFLYASASPHRAGYIGNLAMLISILMYASPLSIVRQVIADRSSDLLPPAQCVIQFANCLAWTAVGAKSRAAQVLVCNGLGLTLGVVQLSLLAMFPSRKGIHAPPSGDVQAA